MNYLTGSINTMTKSGSLWTKFQTNFAYWDALNKKTASRQMSSGPQACFKGTFRTQSDAKTLGQCEPCTAGCYCDWKDWSQSLASPIPCANGTYGTDTGADDKTDCKPVSLFYAYALNFSIF